MIRIATPQDFAAMLKIYEPFVRNSVVTFELEVPSIEKFSAQLNSYMQEAPCLVYEIDKEVIAYAYAKPYRTFGAYAWTRESTVYVNPEYQKNKIASALYTSLIELLKLQNYRVVLAAITLPNIPSVHFHTRQDFHLVGVFNNAGIKFNKSHRVAWYEQLLKEDRAPTDPIRPIQDVLASSKGQEAIKKGSKYINFVPNKSI
jgi:L-amino acid N-acyltransferase YncA